MNKNLLVLGALVAVLLGVGVVAGLVLPASDVSVVAGPKGDKGDKGSQGLRGLAGSSLGASVGPDDFFPYKALNGVQKFADSKKFDTASSTVCSYVAVATSTIKMASARLLNASTTANLFVEIGIGGIESEATTTSLGSAWIPANGGTGDLSVVMASSSVPELMIVSPGQQINVKLAAKNADLSDVESFGLAGMCKFDLEGL